MAPTEIIPTTMIRVSKETHALIEANKRSGESQSECIKRIFQQLRNDDGGLRSEYDSTFEGGFTLVGYREYAYDRNASHLMRNRLPDYVQMYQVLLKKDNREFTVGPVTADDLEKMKGSQNIYVEFSMNMPQVAYVSHQ